MSDSGPAPASVRVLGPARVTVAGVDAPTELLWRKHLALLVYLARSPRRSRTRQHLVGLLWSDRDDKQARHSLSEALRVLRRVLGENAVQADVDQVRLVAHCVTLDWDRLAGFSGRGRGGAGGPRRPLAGRSAELATLVAAWERARGGRGEVVLVAGEPGEGKTRLIEELIARARLDDATVAAARAVPADRQKQWSAVAGLLA